MNTSLYSVTFVDGRRIVLFARSWADAMISAERVSRCKAHAAVPVHA